MRPIYLDNNATTRPADEVVKAMESSLRELWANPSSVHRAGQSVRQKVELAREQVCRLINCRERELVFTSGGTESNNLALAGLLAGSPTAQGGRHVIVTDRLEHTATRQAAEMLGERGAAAVVWLPIDAAGMIDLNALDSFLAARASSIAVVSIQWANNETGAVQPVREIGELCRRYGVRFHCDATQWVGKMPADVAAEPIDLLTFSPHKFHGPKGIGALFVRSGVRIAPLIAGGPQERERRGGTENVAGIIGFGVAADLAKRWLEGSDRTRLAEMRDRFERAICAAVPDAVVNAANVPRLWNTSNIAFPRLEAEAILLLLSERGVYASAGAACSSGSLDPSPVLLAMGVPAELAHGSIRFSLSRETLDEDIDRAIEVVPAVVSRLRQSTTAPATE